MDPLYALMMYGAAAILILFIALITAATIARDSDLAVSRLVEHFQKTAKHCEAAFASGPQASSSASGHRARIA